MLLLPNIRPMNRRGSIVSAFFIILILFGNKALLAQNALVNESAAIYLGSAATITVLGNMENKGTGSFTNNGTVQLSGHLIQNGAVNLNTGSTGIFRLFGTGTQQISGTRIPDFYNLVIDKAGDECILQSGISVSNHLTLTNGNIFLNNHQIDLLTTGSLQNETAVNRIHDLNTNNGTVKVTRNLNALVTINPGNIGAIITSAQNLGNTTVTRGHKSELIISGASINRFYEIVPTLNSGLNATFRFEYFDAELNGQPEEELTQWHMPAGSAVWRKRGGTVNTVSNFVQLAGIDSFNSKISLISHKIIPLPVKLLSFVASKTPDNKVLLTWKTVSEVNFSHFVIQRSDNGVQWTSIGNVDAEPSMALIKKYQYSDNLPLKGPNYYRLKQVDTDNSFEFSEIRLLQFQGELLLQVYPTITKSNSELTIKGLLPASAMAQLFDNHGRMIHKIRLTVNRLQLPRLPAGSYYLRITDTEGVLITKTVPVLILQ